MNIQVKITTQKVSRNLIKSSFAINSTYSCHGYSSLNRIFKQKSNNPKSLIYSRRSRNPPQTGSTTIPFRPSLQKSNSLYTVPEKKLFVIHIYEGGSPQHASASNRRLTNVYRIFKETSSCFLYCPLVRTLFFIGCVNTEILALEATNAGHSTE